MSVAALPGKVRRTTSGTVLRCSDLHVTFPSEAGPVRAVRGLDFDLAAGETMAIVGESGSGKSVTSLAIMGLHPRDGEDHRLDQAARRRADRPRDDAMSKLRGNELAMVFQDPLSSLTPIFTVGDQITEAMEVHHSTLRSGGLDAGRRAARPRGHPQPADPPKSFPHEFSGRHAPAGDDRHGHRNDPDVIIADEPTTALDVTIQAQVLEVLSRRSRRPAPQ